MSPVSSGLPAQLSAEAQTRESCRSSTGMGTAQSSPRAHCDSPSWTVGPKCVELSHCHSCASPALPPTSIQPESLFSFPIPSTQQLSVAEDFHRGGKPPPASAQGFTSSYILLTPLIVLCPCTTRQTKQILGFTSPQPMQPFRPSYSPSSFPPLHRNSKGPKWDAGLWRSSITSPQWAAPYSRAIAPQNHPVCPCSDIPGMRQQEWS